MTRSDLTSKLKRDHPEATTFTDAQINTELDEGQLEIAKLTDCLPQNKTEDLTASTEEFTVPADFLKIDREGGVQVKTAAANTKFDRLAYRSMEQLDIDFPFWRDARRSSAFLLYPCG